MILEIEKLGISVTDNSLRNIIKNDEIILLKIISFQELSTKNF